MESFVVPNCLVDVVLLVGVDGNLEPSVEVSESDVFRCFYNINFDPHVLTAVSASDMINFFPFPHRVQDYPPDMNRDQGCNTNKGMTANTSQMPSSYEGNFQRKTKDSYKSKQMSRSISVNPKLLSRTISSRRSMVHANPSSALPELPISEEVIRSLPSFCFPDGLKVCKEKVESSVQFFVLTDISGNRSYTACLTFYQPFIVEKDDQGILYISLDLDEQQTMESSDKLKCFIPICCATISKYPYYTTMKECLSRLLMYFERDPEEMTDFLKEFANIITHAPVPPAGNIAVNFKLYGLPISINPAMYPDKPVIDLPMYLTFLCFQPEAFLRILTCVLVEEKIVFLSSNFALLTVVMETLMNIILPFKWRFTYSTILPSSALGYLEAPGTFMYGIHTKHKEEVQQVGGLVLVDIDQGTVLLNPDPNVESVPYLPSAAAKLFCSRWPLFQLKFDLLHIIRPFCYNLEDERKYKTSKIEEINTIIAYSCLELMVNLFRDVVNNLRADHDHFNKEQFLNDQAIDDKQFYVKVFGTDMFKMFLRERVSGKADYWSDMEIKTRGYHLGHRTSFCSTTIVSVNKHLSLPHISSTQDIPREKRVITHLSLPELTNLVDFVNKTLAMLTKNIETSDDIDDQTSLLYLRSLFLIAKGCKMVALDDFIKISEYNIAVLPRNFLVDWYSTFDDDEKELLKEKLKECQQLLKIMNRTDAIEGHGRRIRMDPISIPDCDLEYQEFDTIVSLKQMSNDYEIIKRLFEALSPNGTIVRKFTFQTLVECWEANQQNCHSVDFEEINLAEDEMLIKASERIRTDYGIGRIVLTNRRLFFLRDVSNSFREIIKLRDIAHLEKSVHVGFPNSVSTLTIYKKGDGKDGQVVLTAHLKYDRNWWYMVINEMWAGKIVAEAQKDIMVVQHATQNALLIDCIIASGQHEVCTHHNNAEKAAESVSYYTKYMAEKKHILPIDTMHALQRKIDPNDVERERKSVQSLLYTYGDDTLAPRLWIGLSGGKIKVYNAIKWELENELHQDTKDVACLTAVNDLQVWAGSQGIYVIDATTIKCKKILREHSDLVVDIVVSDRSVYTGSVDGTVIRWNAQRLTVDHKIQMKGSLNSVLRSLNIFANRLICGTWSSIIICDLEGVVLNTLSVLDKDKVTQTQLDSLTITSNGELWAGERRENIIHIWDINTGEYKQVVIMTPKIDNVLGTLSDRSNKGTGSMIEVEKRIWTGLKDGRIVIYNIATRQFWKMLMAHGDATRVLCEVKDRYILSGGGSLDGKVCIWSATANTTDSGNFQDGAALTH